MSKLDTALKAISIHNTHDLLSRFGDKGKDIAINYRPRPQGRLGVAMVNKTVIWSPSFHTNQNAPWYDHGCMTFMGSCDKSFEPALAWASNTYGIIDWVPFGCRCRIPKYVLDRAKTELKKQGLL